jgi:putative transposase
MDRLSQPTFIPTRPVFLPVDDDHCRHPAGYVRSLPHWRMSGATYFVTFRQADSLPANVLSAWAEERAAWLWSHGIDSDWQLQDPLRFDEAYQKLPPEVKVAREREEAKRFLLELDRCHGSCQLVRPNAREIVKEALIHFHGQRLWVGDFVVMPNHVHVIAQPFEGVKLEDWLYSVKRFSSAALHKAGLVTDAAYRAGHFWQKESFDRIIRDVDELGRTRRYIAKNGGELRKDAFTHEAMEWLDEFAGKIVLE